MDLAYSNYEDLLSYFYDCPSQFTDTQFWKAVINYFKIPQENLIVSLYTSQQFVLSTIKFLTRLPYRKNSRKILKMATSYMDPSAKMLKKITQELVPCLQNQIPGLSTLNVCLAFYNSIFQQQSPANENLGSYIYLYGSDDGIVVNQMLKWPFQKGGTLAFWFNMSEKTKQCKIFSFVTEQKVGFDIVMRNKKIYIQKQEDETKFRLIKNSSSYLCDAVFNKDVKLCIEFEIKKKFFQPYLTINLIMNNFVMNGVEIDSFNINANLFKVKMFKGFYGKFYAALILTQKMASQVDQLNNQKGFVYENDIRNFSYLFECNSQKVLALFCGMRAVTLHLEPQIQSEEKEVQIEDELKQSKVNIVSKPSLKTHLYDAINNHSASIDSKACCYSNLSITKQIGNYGGFQSFMPFLNLLQVCCSNDELYNVALNQFLQIIAHAFLNKTDSIEKACQLRFFKQLSAFFEKTKMEGFSYQTITKLKEIYISLNTRMLRQKFIQQVVWGVNFGEYLNEQNFSNYIKFIKTFYNEDIQSSLHAFDTTKIIQYILQKLDVSDCCFEHIGSKIVNFSKLKSYPKVLSGILQIVQNILLIKRSEPDIDNIIKKLIATFGFSFSPCFIETFIKFLQSIFTKDELVQNKFINYLQKQNPQSKFYLYKCLSSCSSWTTKGKIIQFILNILQLSFFDNEKKQREMLTLCARYPTINFLGSSSIKSRSNENRDSLQYSQDKLSLNSATMHKLIIINPLQAKDQILLDDCEVVNAIAKWAFSQEIFKLTPEDHENPGLLILMELYKGSTYRIRQLISQMIKQKMKIIRITPELMAWAIECSLIAQYDIQSSQLNKTQIELTKQNLIQIISTYNCIDLQQQQNNELSIIKLVFSSVKSKYPDDIVKMVGNKLFFILCDNKMQRFVQQLKNYEQPNLEEYDILSSRIISNVFTFIYEYYVIKGDGDDNQFDEDLADILQQENYIILDIMDKILQIFVFVATINDRKIIQEANAERNNFVISLLFPQKEKEKQKINIMFLIFGALQTIFDFFEQMDIEPKKKSITLIRKYMIYVIQLTENSGSAKLQHMQQDLRNIFLLNLSFIQQKYYQYFYYSFERHKNIDFQLQTKLRKSVEEIKRAIFITYLDLIELIQYIDEKGDSEHKSFYELMKPKRKHVHKYTLKHIYPAFWKKIDEKIIQLLSLKRQTLRKDAQQKIQSQLILKKISLAFSAVQKNIAKKIYLFVETERKQSDARERKSVNIYKMSQSQKCRNFSQCQQQLVEFRLKIIEEEKAFLKKQKQINCLQNRQTRKIIKETWNHNRKFHGFWTNKNFYQYSQNQKIKADNSLSKYYQRIRSSRQSKYFLMPFIKIVAIEIYKQQIKQQLCFVNFASEQAIEPASTQKIQKRRTSDKLINGLQFIKKKVYSKLAKTITSKEQMPGANSDQKSLFIQNVLWIKPMKVFSGYLKIDFGKLRYFHKPSKNYEHISLFKNGLQQYDTPIIKQWGLKDIQGFILKRFLLKQNSIQIYLKKRKSIFFCFCNNSSEQFHQIVSQISKIICLNQNLNPSIGIDQPLLGCGDTVKMWENLQVTQKWLNYQISNFQYLMCLNIASGRTYCDLNQYPVLPWIFSQYAEIKARKNQDKFRDFSKNTALLGKQQRIKKFQQLYENIAEHHSQQFPVPHYFGFHYLNIGIVLQYLIRINPYSIGSKILQGGKFDITDRLFYSIPESFKCSTSEMSDLRQLIPQFFYFPQFLINLQQHDFGKLQSENRKVSHVQLPDGCLNAYDFIELHREGLQSKQVSLNLHKWIDLIFGYKNSGRQADKCINTYHYLTNDVNCYRIDLVDDPQQKQALESQMAYYGKTPSQLFSRPHPSRPIRHFHDFESWDKIAFSLQQTFVKIFAQSNFQKDNIVQSIMCFNYCQKSKTYLLLNKIGKGMVFGLDKKQIIKINQFSVNYEKVEGINMIDKRNNFKLPVENIECSIIAFGGLWGGKLLVVHVVNSGYDILIKHSETITALRYSSKNQILLSGSSNGQVCKWLYRQKRLVFSQKMHTYSCINSIKVDEDLKIVAACDESGNLSIISLQKFDIIRVIKTEEGIVNFTILNYPYYHILLICRKGRQYCYSLNGCKLQQAQMQIDESGSTSVLQQDCSKQKALVKANKELVFLKTPQLQIQEKLQIGIAQSGFIYISNPLEIVAINNSQMLIWRKPFEPNIQIGISKSL